MAIFVARLTGCTGLIEIGANTLDQIVAALGKSFEYVESLELSTDPSDQGITEYFTYETDNPFAHLPFHHEDLEGFVDQLYHARHLCFMADNEAEAQAWHKEYTERGALEVSYAKAFPGQTGKSGDLYSVVIKVFPPEAKQQVGYTPEADEWLGVDPESDPCHADHLRTNRDMARQRVSDKRMAQGI